MSKIGTINEQDKINNNNEGLERVDYDEYLGTKFHNNRCYLRKINNLDEEISYEITNTSECLSCEDGVRERRYNTLVISQFAILPLFDVLARLIADKSFLADCEKHITALQKNHEKYKKILEVEK